MPRLSPERRSGPRRILDRRERGWLRTLLATLLCMLCFAAPYSSQADDPCLKTAVEFEFYGRPREIRSFSLTRCDGTPNLGVLDQFSVHLRPRDIDAPEQVLRGEGEFVANGIRRFDERLLSRLQAIADRWPERRITVVSGYRATARVGSRHHHAQALDVQVAGIHRAEVAEFARSLPATGVGFYPVSSFTHVDVRDNPSFWVDQSAPGERSTYAPAEREDAILAEALAALPRDPELESPAVAILGQALEAVTAELGRRPIVVESALASRGVVQPETAAPPREASSIGRAAPTTQNTGRADSRADSGSSREITMGAAPPAPSPRAVDEQVDWGVPW